MGLGQKEKSNLGPKCLPCEICGIKIPRFKDREKHLASVHGTSSKVLKNAKRKKVEEARTKEEIRSAKSVQVMTVESEKQLIIFECQLCEFETDSKSGIAKHFAKDHKIQNPIIDTSYKVYYKKKTRGKKFKCKVCDKPLKKERIAAHVSAVECIICNALFECRGYHDDHFKEDHKLDPNKRVAKGRFDCGICNKSETKYTCSTDAMIHYLAIHQDRNPITCLICGKNDFKTYVYANMHAKEKHNLSFTRVISKDFTGWEKLCLGSFYYEKIIKYSKPE